MNHNHNHNHNHKPAREKKRKHARQRDDGKNKGTRKPHCVFLAGLEPIILGCQQDALKSVLIY